MLSKGVWHFEFYVAFIDWGGNYFAESGVAEGRVDEEGDV